MQEIASEKGFQESQGTPTPKVALRPSLVDGRRRWWTFDLVNYNIMQCFPKQTKESTNTVDYWSYRVWNLW